MNINECKKVGCEFLAIRVKDKEAICTDTGSELSQVCNCGIVDEMYKTKEATNA